MANKLFQVDFIVLSFVLYANVYNLMLPDSRIFLFKMPNFSDFALFNHGMFGIR